MRPGGERSAEHVGIRATSMTTASALLGIVLAACGRVDFDPVPVGPDGGPTPDAFEPFACPAGYVAVVGAPALGTQDFCVMRTEAKAWIDGDGDGALTSTEIVADGMPAGDATPVGEYAGTPWVVVTAASAFAACRAMGPGYDLLSNREWMTIARDAEQVAANWSNGVPGTGRLVEGNSDAGPNLAITDPLDGYSDTGNSAADPVEMGWEQRRTLALSTGALVWDLPANVQEWVDWTLGGAYDGAPPCTNRELTELPCAGYLPEDYSSGLGTLDRTHGAGFIIGGSGNAVRRGGQVTDRTMGLAGIYSLNMNRSVEDTFGGTGFRCVYRP